MDEDNLYDEFGNYIGPDLDGQDEEDLADNGHQDSVHIQEEEQPIVEEEHKVKKKYIIIIIIIII